MGHYIFISLPCDSVYEAAFMCNYSDKKRSFHGIGGYKIFCKSIPMHSKILTPPSEAQK